MTWAKGNQLAKTNGGGRKPIRQEVIDRVKKETYQEVLRKIMPDIEVAKKHLALLEKKETLRKFDKEGNVSLVQTDEIDANAVAKGLDMAYKVRGLYPKENNITAIQINVDKSREEFK
jgi:hypothetical protein